MTWGVLVLSPASFGYDEAGRLVEYVGEVGKTSYAYDAEGRIIRQVNPNGTVEELGYDEAGQLWEDAV